MRRIKDFVWCIVDIASTPMCACVAIFLKKIRVDGTFHPKLPFCKRTLMHLGVLPVCRHFYEPFFGKKMLRQSLDEPRNLPGINWNSSEQVNFLNNFHFADELNNLGKSRPDKLSFARQFSFGDSEYWYSMIRLKKPKKIFEIGSGRSAQVAQLAIEKNQEEESSYTCKHLCIEPNIYSRLRNSGADLMCEKVENVDLKLFQELGQNDILFIDSTHIIRPQGDVVFEYLEILPSLKRGVVVQIHDIFSPRDYPKKIVLDEVGLLNEQYLLEAFLSCNPEWKIIGGLNYLYHNHYEKLKRCCPFLIKDTNPSSFYIEKIS